MLQHLGACNVAVLIDVANHKHRDPLGFAQVHHGHGAVLYLGDAAGRRVVFLTVESLDGVDHQDIGFQLLHGLQNVRKAGLREDIQRFRSYPQPLSPKLQLPLTFLAGNIEHAAPGAQAVADLQQQRRFANTGSAAHQHQGTCYCTAAQDTVQLSHARGEANLPVGGHVLNPLGLSALAHGAGFRLTRQCGLLNVLFIGIPGSAGGASALPFWAFIAAVGAEKYGFCLCHRFYLRFFGAAPHSR